MGPEKIVVHNFLDVMRIVERDRGRVGPKMYNVFLGFIVE
jgi:hypothetical protein